MKSTSLALSLLLALGAAAPAAFAQDKDASASASAKAEALRPQMYKPFVAAQTQFNEKKYAEAQASIAEMEKIPDRTPYENLMLARLKAAIAQGTGDVDGIIASFEALLATGKMNAEETRQMERVLGARFYEKKNYPKSITYLERASKAYPEDLALQRLQLQAVYLNNEFPRAVKEGRALVEAYTKAGQKLDHDLLWLWFSAAQNAEDKATGNEILEKLVTLYPKKEYWAEIIRRLESKPGFAFKRLELDVYRLKLAVGAMNGANDYLQLGQAAYEQGFPIEGKAAIDDGYAKGIMGKGSASDQKIQADLKKQLDKAAADDLKTLKAPAATLEKAGKDGNGLVNQGFALVQADQFEKGLPLMEKGMARGLGARAEDGKLHYGIALSIAGRGNEAIKVLQGIGGADGTADLARLWLLHLNQQK